MNGLTSQQQWALNHITRCTCGSWLLITEHQLWELRRDRRPECPHINPAAMEGTAA